MWSELAPLDILTPPPQIGNLANIIFLLSVCPNDANKFKLRVYGVCVCVCDKAICFLPYIQMTTVAWASRAERLLLCADRGAELRGIFHREFDCKLIEKGVKMVGGGVE